MGPIWGYILKMYHAGCSCASEKGNLVLDKAGMSCAWHKVQLCLTLGDPMHVKESCLTNLYGAIKYKEFWKLYILHCLIEIWILIPKMILLSPFSTKLRVDSYSVATKEGNKNRNAIFEGNGTIEMISGVRKWQSIAKSINKHQFLPIDVPFVADIEVNVTLRSVNDS